jgi:hypothetical protein
MRGSVLSLSFDEPNTRDRPNKQMSQIPATRREMVPDTFGFSKVQPRFWRVPNREWEPIRNAPGHGGLTPFRDCEMLDCKT